MQLRTILRKYSDHITLPIVMKKEEWDRGDLMSLIEIPAGVQDEFYSKLNSLTHGEVKIKLMEK